jgi:hypothetical protein
MSDDVTLPGTGAKVATAELTKPGGDAQIQQMQFNGAGLGGVGYIGDAISHSNNEPVMAVQQYGDGATAIFAGQVPPGDTYAEDQILFNLDLFSNTYQPWHNAQCAQLKRIVIVDTDRQDLDLKVVLFRGGAIGTPDDPWDPANTLLQSICADPWIIAGVDWWDIGSQNSVVQHNFTPPDGYMFAAGGLGALVVSGSAGQVVSGVGTGMDLVFTWEWV